MSPHESDRSASLAKFFRQFSFFKNRPVVPELLFKEGPRAHFEYGNRQRNVDKERNVLVKLATRVLDQKLFAEYSGRVSIEEYHLIRASIKNFYLLAAPCLNPDAYEKILEAETKLATKHIGRNALLGQEVWIANERSKKAFNNVDIESLEDEEKREVERWLQPNDGLLDHTFIAAEFLKNLIIAIQENIKEHQKHGKINDVQAQFLWVDPYLYSIKMLFHDLGRLITQHRLAHEFETQNILTAALVDKNFREEPAYVPLLNAEITDSIYQMVADEDGFMRFIFYLADFTSKVKSENGKLRRPQDFLTIIDRQSARYSGLDKSAQIVFDQDDYGIFEGITLTKILFWLRDHQLGLGFSKDKLETVYQQTELVIPEIRKELGII